MYTFNMQAYSKPYQNTITWNQDVNQILKTWGVICSPGLQKTERNRGSREQGRQRGVFLSLNIFFFSLIALHFFFFWFVQVLWKLWICLICFLNWFTKLFKSLLYLIYYIQTILFTYRFEILLYTRSFLFFSLPLEIQEWI